MPAYPYVPTVAARPSLRQRRLFRRAIVVAGFLLALLIAAMLRAI